MTNKFTSTKLVVPIDKIAPNRWNPNVQSKETFEKTKQSIEKFGLVGSVYVREINHTSADYEILDGEHRWKAAKEMGYTEIPVENLGAITDDQVKVLTVLFNNLRGKDDVEKRAAIFKQLDAGQLQLLPFTAEQIEAEKSLVDFDFSIYDKEETVPARGTSNVLIHLELTKEEKRIWDEACTIAKAKEKLNETQLFMYMLKFYLQLRAREVSDYTKIAF